MQSCAGEKSTARPADFLDIADILVDVGVHGHRNLGMPGNALQGFYVYAPCGLQLGQECVAKHMRGYAFGNSGSLRFVPSNHAWKFADERNFFWDIRAHLLVLYQK